jgi:hypothetical protein
MSGFPRGGASINAPASGEGFYWRHSPRIAGILASIHGGRDASCRSDAGISCHIFIPCILRAYPGCRGGSILPARSQLGLSGQLPVRHPPAMPRCRVRHERLLRHQSALCRSAAALIAAQRPRGRMRSIKKGSPRCESLHCSSFCSRSQECFLPANRTLRARFGVQSSVVPSAVVAALR